MRAQTQYRAFRVGLFTLATLPFVGCQVDAPQTVAAEQAVINPPLPSNLNLALNAKTTVTIGPFARAFGDVASSGPTGSLLFDVNSTQGSGQFSALANTVTVRVGASADHVFGNDITIEGSVSQESLGLDPGALPQVPVATAITPGITNVTVKRNETKQLCPGQFGAVSLGIGATLNLNGGVYEVTRLNLADGAHLEPSEPVVILVSGAMTAGTNASVRPSAQALNPMSAKDIRIEVGGAVTVGDGAQLQVHLLAPANKVTIGEHANLIGAAWAKSIAVGAQSVVTGEDTFLAQAADVPPPCNDNNSCTTDACVASGAIAFCHNTPVTAGTSCADANMCNGVELCNAIGQCQAGTDTPPGAACPDGDACNGDEVCNGAGSCLAGTAPTVSDDNPCTADACDPDTGVSHIPLPDGTSCSGAGVCTAGQCSVAGAVFSEDFVQFETAAQQCDSWNDFLDNQLVEGNYSRISLSGSLDATGAICDDPAVATRLCLALHRHRFAQEVCGGRVWSVASCGGAEITTEPVTCACFSGETHDVRPCAGADWGGMLSVTCNPPSQSLTVVCE